MLQLGFNTLPVDFEMLSLGKSRHFCIELFNLKKRSFFHEIAVPGKEIKTVTIL